MRLNKADYFSKLYTMTTYEIFCTCTFKLQEEGIEYLLVLCYMYVT